ncbi:MAG TPA: NADH-quinone oxidoreductase subunit H [Drouetiella sp.]
MNSIFTWIIFLSLVVLVPPLCLGILRKTKARLQNRIGAPVWQPLFDLTKLVQKQETLSSTMCGVFRFSTVVGLATSLTLIWLVPWIPTKPWAPAADVFLVVYILALEKVFTMMGAMDSGSSFGAFGASREATLNMLVEPALCLSLVAPAILAGSTNLSTIFSTPAVANSSVVWALAGGALFLVSLVEFCRMPVDDPTTHLELTMIHEAMILEASAKNLLLLEYSQMLKMSLFWGLSVQCIMHAIPACARFSLVESVTSSVIGIFFLASLVGLLESLIVKLQWRKIPEFVAYVVTISLIAVVVAISGKLT